MSTLHLEFWTTQYGHRQLQTHRSAISCALFILETGKRLSSQLNKQETYNSNDSTGVNSYYSWKKLEGSEFQQLSVFWITERHERESTSLAVV